MKFTEFLIAGALSLLALNATAQNLYRPGTQGYEMAAYAERVLPSTVSPYFVMMKKSGFFTSELSSEADSVISQKSRSIIANENWPAQSGVTAFTRYIDLTPETDARKVCVIVFEKPDSAKIGSTFMHELMHCRIGASEIKGDYRAQLMRVLALDNGIPAGSKIAMFEEVLARALSLTFLVNDGITEDGDFFMQRLQKPYPSNPGPKSVPRAMALCIDKGSCTVDVGVLARKLLDDKEFVDYLRADMIEGDAYDVKTGFK